MPSISYPSESRRGSASAINRSTSSTVSTVRVLSGFARNPAALQCIAARRTLLRQQKLAQYSPPPPSSQQKIGIEVQPPLRHLRRLHRPNRSRRRITRIRRRRQRPPAPALRSASQTPACGITHSPRTSNALRQPRRLAASLALSNCQLASTGSSGYCDVTSSPVVPSPRVSPRTAAAPHSRPAPGP